MEDDRRPFATSAATSCAFGVAWWVIVVAVYGWSSLAVGSETSRDTAFPLVIGWCATGPFALVYWFISVGVGESRYRGWYLAWIGMLMGMSGPVHLIVLLLIGY